MTKEHQTVYKVSMGFVNGLGATVYCETLEDAQAQVKVMDHEGADWDIFEVKHIESSDAR